MADCSSDKLATLQQATDSSHCSASGSAPEASQRQAMQPCPSSRTPETVEGDSVDGPFGFLKGSPRGGSPRGSLRGSLRGGSPKLHKSLLGERYGVCYPRSAQHLLSLLQQPDSEKLLLPDEDGDNPLHYIVRQPRPDKVDILATLLTHTSVDINSHGKGGMTALHYAVQANDVGTVQVLLAFGADVNQVNHRRRTSLDVATYSWLAQERQTKISGATNNLAPVQETKLHTNYSTFPDVTWSPVPSPLLRRANVRVLARTESSSSWVYVEKESDSSNDERGGTENSVDCSRTSSEDSREFTSSVMPIKSADLADEVLDNNPGDVALHKGTLKSYEAILNLLYSVHAVSGKAISHRFQQVPLLSSFSESSEFQQMIDAQQQLNPFWESSDMQNSVKIRDYVEGKTVFSLFEELDYNINLSLASQSSLSPNPDEAIAITFQQREMRHFKRTMKEGMGFEVNGGSRLLFLDGGGIKGLVQIEVMRQLEDATGRRITELFDWIIGSSIGGILALGMVYAKKSLKELQQMCFKLKEEVFAKPRAGIAFNSKAMEKMIIDEFGYDFTMSDVKHPKVLVAAVNKRTAPPQLHFFNNCFKDRFSNTPVWKVARYTTAAPMFFTEFEDYVDGGVLANNPCDYGLTAIQNFHRENHVNLPISMVVSIGTGIYPPEELGKIDAQEFLFFGKHWFNFTDTIKSRTRNLLSLLTTALVESEIVAKNCNMRCHEQNIPYYRFSPQLSHVISAGETDTDRLVEMMLETRVQAPHQGVAELASLFQLVADASKKNKYRRSRIMAEQNQNTLSL